MTVDTAVQSQSEQRNAPGRAYWAMSRLVNHGWRVVEFGTTCGGWIRLRTPSGHLLPVASDPANAAAAAHGLDNTAPRTTSLAFHACDMLNMSAQLPGDSAEAATRVIAAMLRLHTPAGRAYHYDSECPWDLPGVERQPCESVRRAYWAATTLTDDYGWHVSALSKHGFETHCPYDSTPRWVGRRSCDEGTTAARLVALLSAITDDAALSELAELVDHHQSLGWAARIRQEGPR